MGQTILRALREDKNWTQDFVASKLGITQPAYAKIESGQTRLTIDRAKELGALFEIEPEILLYNDATVNYNTGTNSHGINDSTNAQYTNNDLDFIKDLYEKVIEEKEKVVVEKDKQIKLLSKTSELLENLLKEFKPKK